MSKPMTKTQLVAAVADAMGGDKKTANAALDAIAAVVSREVASGGTVTIPGLGKVACKARPERQVRNPATGETMTKPADKQTPATTHATPIFWSVLISAMIENLGSSSRSVMLTVRITRARAKTRTAP